MPKTLRSPRQRRLLEVLVGARAASGLTQAVLAERMGRPKSFVAKYENGERRLDVIEFIQFIQAIGGEPKKPFVEILKAPE